MNFSQFYDILNGTMYSDEGTPPPQSYHFLDYAKQVTNGSTNTNGNWDLIPLTNDDMARYSAKDVEEFTQMHNQDPKPSLGEPLKDEELKKYTGI